MTVSGLESIVNEISGNTAILEKALDEVIDAILEKIEGGTKVSLAPIAFFTSFEKEVRTRCNQYWEARKAKFSDKIFFVPRIEDIRMSKDGVHLTEASARKFLEHVTNTSLKYFTSEANDAINSG